MSNAILSVKNVIKRFSGTVALIAYCFNFLF